MLLDHQPFVALASRTPRFHVDQREISIQPLTMKAKFQVALFDHGGGFSFGAGQVFSVYSFGRQRLPGAHVPHHD